MNLAQVTGAPFADPATAARPRPSSPAVVSQPAESVDDPAAAGQSAFAQRVQQHAVQSRPVDPTQVEQAIERTNSFLNPVAQALRFEIDKESGTQLIKVVDTDTNKVLRQIPTEEMLAISKALDRFKGVLLQQEA